MLEHTQFTLFDFRPKLTNPDKTASNTTHVTTRSLADKGKSILKSVIFIF